MAADFAPVFAALKPILTKYEKRMVAKADTPIEYTLLTKTPSPFPQHKGQPLYFGSVRQGKAYVSFHLVPLYMCKELTKSISPALRKRMGKACFDFKVIPDLELLKELKALTKAGYDQWAAKKWL